MFFYYLIFSDLKASELAFFSSLLSRLACFKFVFRFFFSSGVSCFGLMDILDLTETTSSSMSSAPWSLPQRACSQAAAENTLGNAGLGRKLDLSVLGLRNQQSHFSPSLPCPRPSQCPPLPHCHSCPTKRAVSPSPSRAAAASVPSPSRARP